MLNRLAITLLLALAAAPSAGAAAARTPPETARIAWLNATIAPSPTARFDIGSLNSTNIAATMPANGAYYVTDLGTAPSGTFRRIRNAGAFAIPFVMDGKHIIGFAPNSPPPPTPPPCCGTGTSNVLPVSPNEIVEFVSLGADSWQLVQYLPLGIENFGIQQGAAGAGIPPTNNPPDNWFQLGPIAGAGPEPDYPFAVNWTLHGGKLHTHGIQIMLPGDSPPIDFMNADVSPVDQSPVPWSRLTSTLSFAGHVGGRNLVNIAASGPPVYEFPNSSQPTNPGYGHAPSFLYQARNAQITFHMTEIPTASHGGGAITFETARNGTVTSFQRMWLAENGNLVELGKGAIEACGITYPYDWSGKYIIQANAPCNDSDFYRTEGWGNVSIIATDYTNSKLDANNAALAIRDFGAHGEGLDLGLNGTNSRIEFAAVHNNARTPALAVDPSTAQILYPVQSAFSATLSNDLAAVTGDGTLAKVAFNSALYNRHSDFSTGSGLYTAPVTGIYSLSGQVTLSRFSSTRYRKVRIEVISTDRAYSYLAGLPNPDADGQVSVPFDFSIPMTAGATAYVALEVEGGPKGVGVTTASYFNGRLVE